METSDANPLAAFAARWGFAPDSPLLRRALTHRSAASVTASNERLEFLGDALLGAFVARYAYEHLPEGVGEDTLSRARVEVVRRETLAAAARALGLAALLTVGHGERKEDRHQRDSLLADAYEALVAAVFLERGQEALERFLTETLADALSTIVAHPPAPDPKTLLQMRLQAVGRGTPTYQTVDKTTDSRQPHFTAEAEAPDGTILGVGAGSTKRAAQTAAARMALAELFPQEGEG